MSTMILYALPVYYTMTLRLCKR